MTPELTVLVIAALLLVVHFCWVAVRANLEIGTEYFLTPRDDAPPRELSPGLARLRRAFANHLETFPLFIVAVVALALAGKSSGLTVACAWLYLGARVLYVPAYLYGWNPGRSLIWAVGFAATLIMLVAALL